nr:ionotropic receptor 100b [Achelura yunnanensis]
MKTTVLLFNATFLIIMQVINSETYEHISIETFDRPNINRMQISLISNRTRSIVIDEDKTTEEVIKTMMVREITVNQSVLLLKRNQRKKIDLDKILDYHTIRYNVIFIIDELSTFLLHSAVLKHLSKWSLVHVIVTSNSTEYECKESNFKPNIKNKIDQFLNFIWHKYEMISTIVEFPFVCPCHYVIYDGKILTNNSVYDRKIKVIRAENSKELAETLSSAKSKEQPTHGFPLRINIFYRFPTSITECYDIDNYVHHKFTTKFCGLDAMVMDDVINYFRFKVIFVEFENGTEIYGYVEEDGKISGTLGAVVRGEIDISFNSRFLVPYLNDGFLFLHYISSDSLCAVTKTPDVIPLWFYPWKAYEIDMWLVIFSILIGIGAFTWILATLTRKKKDKKISLISCILDAMMTGFFGITLNVKPKFKISKASCFICSIILLAIYQGFINYLFTTLIRFKMIKTLDDLYESGAVLYTSPAIIKVIDCERNKNLRIVNEAKLWPNKLVTSLEFIIDTPKTATVERKNDLLLKSLNQYKDENGRPLLYAVDECFSTYYLSYIANKDFLFSKKIMTFLERLNEAGLPPMYYKWTQRALKLEKFHTNPGSEPRPISAVSMNDQRVAFILLCIGYIISSITFIGEKVLFKYVYK